jgi:hypothetical protein
VRWCKALMYQEGVFSGRTHTHTHTHGSLHYRVGLDRDAP